MGAIDRVKQHFQDLGTRQIEVPEWGDESGPLIVYWTPLTAREHRTLTKGETGLSASLLCDVLVMKAQDRNGRPLFDVKDRPALMEKGDLHVITRVATAIFLTTSVEQAEKN